MQKQCLPYMVTNVIDIQGSNLLSDMNTFVNQRGMIIVATVLKTTCRLYES
jgi:hypothetical protein